MSSLDIFDIEHNRMISLWSRKYPILISISSEISIIKGLVVANGLMGAFLQRFKTVFSAYLSYFEIQFGMPNY